jgi:hypothetical protein
MPIYGVYAGSDVVLHRWALATRRNVLERAFVATIRFCYVLLKVVFFSMIMAEV